MSDAAPRGSANGNHRGLTTAEAQVRLKQFGPNAVVEEKAHPLKQFLKRFWAPIPWLLEATIIIQLFLGEEVEAAVIGGLLVVERDVEPSSGRPCAKSAGAPAPATACGGARPPRQCVDHVASRGIWCPETSSICGRAASCRRTYSWTKDRCSWTNPRSPANRPPLSVESGKTAYAGSMVRGGEATGEITATGARTFFGKTAELVRTRRLGQPAGARDCGRGQEPLRRQRGDGGDRDRLRAPRRDVPRVHSAVAADHFARLHSSRAAGHLHARCRAWARWNCPNAAC